jgi:hypothetical protein
LYINSYIQAALISLDIRQKLMEMAQTSLINNDGEDEAFEQLDPCVTHIQALKEITCIRDPSTNKTLSEACVCALDQALARSKNVSGFLNLITCSQSRID